MPITHLTPPLGNTERPVPRWAFDQYPLAWLGLVHELSFSSGWWLLLARVCITPAMLWGPIVLALAVAYYRRRRPA